MGDGDSEDGHHGIADELLDRPSVPLDDCAHLLEVASHEAAQRLGIGPLAQRRRSRDVAEEDGDDLADLTSAGSVGELGPATAAEAEPFGVLLAAAETNRHE